MDFEQVWLSILDTVEINNVIYTLAQHKPNNVKHNGDKGLIVTTVGKPQLVKKAWIESAWDVLHQQGYLTADDIPRPGRYRSSFIMALLSHLPYTHTETYPNKLYLNLKKQCGGNCDEPANGQ